VKSSAGDETHCVASDTASNEDTTNNISILSINDLVFFHAHYIFPQNNKEYFKAYTHLHGIDMQMHSITKPTKQKAHDVGLSDLHDEEFKLFAMEYNVTEDEPDNELDNYVNTLQRSNEDYDPGINDKFLNSLDPKMYAMQMQKPDVLTHAHMKRQVDADKFIDAQRPEIEELMDINTFEFIHKTKLPARTRYLDLIRRYIRKIRPYGSLHKYKARVCVNIIRNIQGIDCT
jgi:hypothetical protein